MAQVIIEDLDQVVIEKLEAIAQEHGRSLQAELKHIVEAAVQSQTLDKPDVKEAIASQVTSTVAKIPEELGWPPGFFERTFGCLRDDPIVRWPQGEYEEREQLL
jgi:plasmid stability protein